MFILPLVAIHVKDTAHTPRQALTITVHRYFDNHENRPLLLVPLSSSRFGYRNTPTSPRLAPLSSQQYLLDTRCPFRFRRNLHHYLKYLAPLHPDLHHPHTRTLPTCPLHPRCRPLPPPYGHLACPCLNLPCFQVRMPRLAARQDVSRIPSRTVYPDTRSLLV